MEMTIVAGSPESGPSGRTTIYEHVIKLQQCIHAALVFYIIILSGSSVTWFTSLDQTAMHGCMIRRHQISSSESTVNTKTNREIPAYYNYIFSTHSSSIGAA